MKIWSLSIAASIVATCAFAQQPIENIAQSELPSLLAVYKDIHSHPELSAHEERTSAIIAKELRVLVRTDMDALPVEEKTGLPYASKVTTKDDEGKDVHVMHACGHDAHMAAFIGTVRALQRLKDQWHGTIMFVGQPAEETLNGARALLKGGLYDRFGKPDFALGRNHQRPANDREPRK